MTWIKRSFHPGILVHTFRLTAPHYPVTLQRPGRLGNHRALSIGPMISVEMENYPVVRLAEVMRPGSIREQCCEMPVVALGVKNRQPGLAGWIEASWGDLAQLSFCRPFAVLPVDVQQ